MMNASDLPEILESLKTQFEYRKSCGINYFQKPEEQKSGLSEDNQSLLDKVVEEMGDCKRCKLHSLRKNIVFGVGNSNARLMFVGETPGAEEDEQGIPFVGKAGQLLTNIIEAINLKRSDVYIANIIKCRPPSNRNPDEDEITTCISFLKKQIEIIAPEIVCTLGNIATRALLDTDLEVTKLRGRFHERSGLKVMPTYHPSYLLMDPSKKRETWEDMKKIKKEYFKE
jgi:uracil-DNA glycosylase family 4